MSLGFRNRAILEVSYSTGVRCEELLNLSIFDVECERRRIRVLGKGRKERTVPIGRHAADYVKHYLKNGRPKLLGQSHPDTTALWISCKGHPLTIIGLRQMLRNYGKKAGIKQNVNAQILRRSCATHMLDNGAHPVVVAQLLGHAKLSTLSHYLKVTITELKQMHENTKPGK